MIGDLCLPFDDVEPELHRERVAALLARGYEVVASVHTATGRLTEADRCFIVPLGTNALAAASTDAKRALALRAGASSTLSAAAGAVAGAAGAAGVGTAQAPACPLRQLSRLHFVAADAVQAAQLAAADDVVRSYNIVSITPKSERVLHQACSSLDVDIVSLELGQRSSFKLRPPAVKAALRRGIHFEICYASGLREPTARRNLFCNAQALVRATRGKNILLSSSARSAFEVRSSLELLHMATLFGLTRQQAQDAIRLAPKAVLAHAAARLAGKGVTAVAAAPAAAGAAAAAAAGAVAQREEDAEMQDAGGDGEAAPPEPAPEAGQPLRGQGQQKQRPQQARAQQLQQAQLQPQPQQQAQPGGVATRSARKRSAAVS